LAVFAFVDRCADCLGVLAAMILSFHENDEAPD